MTEFHERPFGARFAALGDQAEEAFGSLNPRAHRLGLCRPQLNMAKMQATMRYTPDFLTEDGAYEVMGFSSKGNGTLKLKLEKADALTCWGLIMPTWLWVYDSGRKRYWCEPARDWIGACHQHAERKFFNDNNRAYWELHHEHFPGAPMSLQVAA